MSTSDEANPTADDLRAVQVALNRLDALCEAEPQTVIDVTEAALPVLARWTRSDAYAWALALRGKAFRLLDNLAGVLESANTALESLHGDEPVAANLHLEAGMALNQVGMQREAIKHLRSADRIFGLAEDDSGRSWALVSLAEAYADSASEIDPEPVVKLAIELAQRSADRRSEQRGWKQLAVVHRYRGRPLEAIDAIHHALGGDLTPHALANSLLELGHLKSWMGDYAASDEAYQEASIAYLEYADLLGQANVERAMATNALILGRNVQGLRRLDRAAQLFRRIGSDGGLGHVLRDRALVRLSAGDPSGAREDIEEGLRCFRRGTGVLGLAGMLRTAAKVRHLLDDPPGAVAALEEARMLTKGEANPLAEAGLLLLQAEIGKTPAQRALWGRESAQFYRSLRIPTGEAYALSHVARAEVEAGNTDGALIAMRRAILVLRSARCKVSDPSRRGDHDFALRDVTTNLLHAGHRVGAAAESLMADLIVDEAPLGLRRAFHDGEAGSRAAELVSRIGATPSKHEGLPAMRAHLLQRIGALLTTLAPGDAPPWPTFDAVCDAHPGDAVIAFAAPTRHGTIPVAWRLPGEKACVDLVVLTDADVEQIDGLGYAFESERSDILWLPEKTGWQAGLARVFVPLPIRKWLMEEGARSIAVLFAPVLAHVPIEALLIGDEPLGVRAAVVRLPGPITTSLSQRLVGTVAYLDPSLPWRHEREALRTATSDPQQFRSDLAPGQLIVASCHGESALRAEGALVTSAGDRVIDALDLLAQPLSGSVMVLEACFAGRYMGPRTGEPLNLAIVGLLAGASAVVAGMFAVPADDHSTGVIVGSLLIELSNGCPAPEALRRARETYWRVRPESLPVPGMPGTSMSGDAPWAWAGMCVYSR